MLHKSQDPLLPQLDIGAENCRRQATRCQQEWVMNAGPGEGSALFSPSVRWDSRSRFRGLALIQQVFEIGFPHVQH